MICVHLGNEAAESSTDETVEGRIGTVSENESDYGTRDATAQISGEFVNNLLSQNVAT